MLALRVLLLLLHVLMQVSSMHTDSRNASLPVKHVSPALADSDGISLKAINLCKDLHMRAAVPSHWLLESLVLSSCYFKFSDTLPGDLQ